VTAFAVGDRVHILSCFYPDQSATVTAVNNGMPTMTVTVMLDATQHSPAQDTYFAPDELEIIPNGTAEPDGND
jgi:hypothetical protein